MPWLWTAKGATLMPGLVEAHAHLTFPSSVDRMFAGLDLPAEEHLLVAAHNARVLLDHGFTPAYSAGSRGQQFEIALRDEIDAGYLLGPRLRASPQDTSGSRATGLPASHDTPHERTPRGLRDNIAAMADLGVDGIKFELSGNDIDGPGESARVLFTDDEVAAIGEQTRQCGVWLSCHSQAADSIKQAVHNGFRILYHCTLADNEALDLLEAAKERVFVAPDAGLPYSRIHDAADFGIDHNMATAMGAFDSLDGMIRVMPELRRRGVRVLPGGDYGFPYNPIGRNARDLELFVTLFGFTPIDALVAATRHGGELMDLPVGQIRPNWPSDPGY
jgi:imidazolonepropionase-like amidohydrolase